MTQFIANVRLVSPGEEIRTVWIEIDPDSELIVEIYPENQVPPLGGDVQKVLIDGSGELNAFPGFIDIHTHGANGVDLSMAQEDTVFTIAEAKLKEGVTTFLPTTWTASQSDKCAMARSAAHYRSAGEPFARTPFLHIEGPYLNPEQAGAQDAREMRPPDAGEIREIHEICPVGLVSLAIELEGALPFLCEMKKMGIITSAAHSAASYAEFAEARENGLSHLTHYCNQMSGLHHREVGLVGAGLLDDEVLIEIICDQIHLCPDMIRLAFKHRRLEQMMLITDSIAAAHLGDGIYPLHDTHIIVKDGAARIPAGNLAGSIVKMNEALRNTAALTRLPLNDLSRTTALNQATSLGLRDRGRIQQGMVADLTLLDSDFSVIASIVGGKKKWMSA